MKKKIFAISDIHSFYTPMKKALDDAGFDSENPDHLLVVCGDLFDRGDETLKVLDYIESLPNKILINGNHEQLLMNMLYRMYPESHDYHNGTVKTLEHLFEKYGNKDENGVWDQDELAGYLNIKEAMKRFQEQFVNYFETENYIFVHSWLPMHIFYNDACYFPRTNNMDWMENWRAANQHQWNDAMWGNPFDLAQDGYNKTGKTIVFGHWHCSYGWYINYLKDNGYPPEGSRSQEREFGELAKWDPYINKEQGIIGIDRCTAVTGECNVIIIEDEILEGE